MKLQLRILSVLGIGAGLWVGSAMACNQHPPDVSHERWLAQIQSWNKEYDAKQAAKAQAAAGAADVGSGRGARTRDEAGKTTARRGGGDPQVRTVGRTPQSLPAVKTPASVSDERKSRRYR